jgi:hypothetical protein
MITVNREYPAGSGNTVPVMFVASSTLHWFAKPDVQTNAEWDKEESKKWWDTERWEVEQPDGKIRDLAATEEYLYALYSNNQLKRIALNSASGAGWGDKIEMDANADSKLKDYAGYETIFSSNNTIFIGVRRKENKNDKAIPCAILYMTDSDSNLKLLEFPKYDNNLLTGVAFNEASYFLCTNNLYKKGGSLYIINGTAVSTSSVDEVTGYSYNGTTKISDIPFTGIISLENGTNPTILAIDRSGTLYTIDAVANTFTATEKTMGTSTGALGLWYKNKTDPLPSLLLAGYQGQMTLTTTSYTNGYKEFDLKWSGADLDISGSDFHDPGKLGINGVTTLNSTDSYERYVSTIGKYPIKNFYQTPKDIDEGMTLFVSTLNAGLWSYRSRQPDGWQWNAEE